MLQLLILLNIICLGASNINDKYAFCEKNNQIKCGNEKLSGSSIIGAQKPPNEYNEEESNGIILNIQQALATYVPCAPKMDTNCSCHASVIIRDLAPFHKTGITKNLIVSSAKYGTRYKILNNKLYREDNCMFPARCSGIEHFIRPLLYRLENMDLVVNTRDWPQINSKLVHKYPVFSFSKTDEYGDIMYPAWSFWAGGPAILLHPTGIGRWDLQSAALLRAAEEIPWAAKHAKGFFRGSRTSDERDSLVLLSRRIPHLVDAQYTKNQAWKSTKDTLHYDPAKEASFEEHCHYKYLFNFRGVAASFRLKHLFLCKSLVFHVGSDWMEFFYSSMQPWVHYVPLRSYPSEAELESVVRFFQKHDNLAQQMAERGHDFIKNHLRMQDVECYWERLLTDYQNLIKYKVEEEEDMHAL